MTVPLTLFAPAPEDDCPTRVVQRPPADRRRYDSWAASLALTILLILALLRVSTVM